MALRSVSENEHNGLFWALKGAGHNFGVVMSYEYKIYDRTLPHESWAVGTFAFTGDKLEEIGAVANKHLEH